jgi:hypothetical protein
MNLDQIIEALTIEALTSPPLRKTMPKIKAKKYPKGKALLDDPNWKYYDSMNTNVLETFKRHGWTPPSERKGKA